MIHRGYRQKWTPAIVVSGNQTLLPHFHFPIRKTQQKDWNSMGLPVNKPLLADKLVVSLVGVEREEDATALRMEKNLAEAGETVDPFATGSKEFR